MVDTVKTRAQLIERAAINLGLVQPGEALSSEDYNTLDDLVDAVIAQIAAEGIAYIANPDEIELELFLPLAAVLANHAGPSFGAPINDAALMRDQNMLRKLTTAQKTDAPQKAVYY